MEQGRLLIRCQIVHIQTYLFLRFHYFCIILNQCDIHGSHLGCLVCQGLHDLLHFRIIRLLDTGISIFADSVRSYLNEQSFVTYRCAGSVERLPITLCQCLGITGSFKDAISLITLQFLNFRYKFSVRDHLSGTYHGSVKGLRYGFRVNRMLIIIAGNIIDIAIHIGASPITLI